MRQTITGTPPRSKCRPALTRGGIGELYGWTHESLNIESLNILLRHIASVPGERLREVVPGFGIATVWKQLAHIVEGEELWVCDLQDKARLGWGEKDCARIEVLLAERAGAACDTGLSGWVERCGAESDVEGASAGMGGGVEESGFYFAARGDAYVSS
jgi:hypothetical protein